MSLTIAPSPTTAAGDADGWSELRAAVTGRLVGPADPDWDAARTGWVVQVDQRPAAGLEVADATDVVLAVRWAAHRGMSVAAQPRGHAARACLDGALLLR